MFKFTLLSKRMPLIKGPNADAKTIVEEATALTDPRYFVPKYSGQNAPATAVLIPCNIPRKLKANAAPIIELVLAAVENPITPGNRQNGKTRPVLYLSIKNPTPKREIKLVTV